VTYSYERFEQNEGLNTVLYMTIIILIQWFGATDNDMYVRCLKLVDTPGLWVMSFQIHWWQSPV